MRSTSTASGGRSPRALGVNRVPTFVIITYWAFVMSFVFTGGIAFDRVIQLQSQSYPEDWERDGKPWNCNGAWQRCSNAWMFSTPVWAQHNIRAIRLLRLVRGLTGLFLLSMFAGIGFFFPW